MLNGARATQSLVVASRLPAWLRLVLYAALACELAAIGWFALFGGKLQAELQQAIGVGSLALHVLAFGVTASTAFALWSPLLRVALALLCAAGLIEVAQLFAPERQLSLADFLAGGSGIVIVWLAYGAAQASIASRAGRRH